MSGMGGHPADEALLRFRQETAGDRDPAVARHLQYCPGCHQRQAAGACFEAAVRRGLRRQPVPGELMLRISMALRQQRYRPAWGGRRPGDALCSRGAATGLPVQGAAPGDRLDVSFEQPGRGATLDRGVREINLSALIEVQDGNFKEVVLDAERPVLVDFSAEWCGPCKQLKPVIEALAGEYAGRVDMVHVDVDQARDTAAGYGVMSVPTLLFFKNGEPADRCQGVV